METTTIVAIATAQVEGAISILRLSGPDAIAIADSLFKGKQTLKNAMSHTISYGKIRDPTTQKQIDEVLISLFLAPRTYTRENVVEIHCHGGVEVTNEILLLTLQQGAQLAQPGEFTKRAFLNGRIDLTQAEAVADMITADNRQAIEMAVNTIDGKLSKKIIEFREDTVEILANIEVNIDYPEYDDVEFLTDTLLIPKITVLENKLTALLKTSRTGKVIKNGVKTAIIGKPNVGKSSLLNALLREQKAIVTEVPGTTRDIVEGHIRLEHLTLHIIDTAGIRETDDIVEKIGIEKTRTVIEEAELILLVLDASRILEQIDEQLLDLVAGKNTIIICNKVDLKQQLTLPASEYPLIEISAATESGLENLLEAILEKLDLNIHATNAVFLSNIRHINLLSQSKASLNAAKESAESGMPIDIITIDLQDCYSRLGEILGVEIQDDLLNTLFSRFCLGK
ncbi:tRNA U34 5-methylaminomethyl-2-thiouridine modification GTPase [Erysipelotrichaceae bacterium]|nr:tRNA U34 5-methylaminomethyl-2-thiouridine modification GTPase [Erysipelotrichaceae bacterium]